MLFLDTDIAIDIQRKHPPAVAWFSALSELPVVSGIVLMELVQDARNKRQLRSALTLAAPLTVIWPTESDCQQALAHFITYHLSHGLGLLDALIGATPMGRSAALRTFNDKHVRMIPGLVIQQPYKR